MLTGSAMTVLVRNRGMRPMWSVLNRYGIGNNDKYDRGLWITVKDLKSIRENMLNDSTIISRLLPRQIMVNGSNQHNQVDFMEFVALFAGIEFNSDTYTTLESIYNEIS